MVFGNGTYNVCESPLVISSKRNPISDLTSDMTDGIDFSDCSLGCEFGDEIYGLSKDQQNIINAFKVIGMTICFIAILFLFVNQFLDEKLSNESLFQKPIIFHIPIIISISCFFIVGLMVLSEIIGKEFIVCDGNEITFYNYKYGHYWPCTIHGILFYNSILFYSFYIVLLSFIVYRQFKNPLNPLFGIKNIYYHLIIIIIVIIFDISLLLTYSLDGIAPMGVCLPGFSNVLKLSIFMGLPITLSLILTAFFSLLSFNLLKHKISFSRTNLRTKLILKRLLYYCIGILITQSLLLATIWYIILKN